MVVCPGLEVFLNEPQVTGPVGLLANSASITRDGRTAVRALQSVGMDITMLFGPEHGYYGLGAAGETIGNDHMNNIPIYSLYGEYYAPPTDLLRSLSAVLIDLQDVGTRWYTLLTTIRNMLTACAEAEVPVYVFDRPNPQGGILVEGLRAEPAFFSMVAPAAMPVRHGLNDGEAASWLNASIGAALTVIPMDGWKRQMLFSDTGLQWASPSPNMPQASTTLVYSGTCLIEGLSVSEGRGTALPFEQIGAPFINADHLSEVMNDLELPGVFFSPCWFRPTTSKFVGEACGGVRVHVTDGWQVHGFALGLHLVSTLRTFYPESAFWLQYDGRMIIDRLAATTRIREALDAGRHVEDILADCEQEAKTFQTDSAAFFLYD